MWAPLSVDHNITTWLVAFPGVRDLLGLRVAIGRERLIKQDRQHGFLEPNEYMGHFNMFVREGNGTPLQYSCLENPMDGGAW